MLDFTNFDNEFDLEGLRKDINEAAKSNDFDELPDGEYEVKLEKVEACFSKKTNKPMVKFVWEIVKGTYKKRKIFQYFMLMGSVKVDPQTGKNKDSTGFMIHKYNEFMRMLVDKEFDPSFTSFSEIPNMCKKVETFCKENFEYLLKLETKDNYTNYSIVELFEID